MKRILLSIAIVGGFALSAGETIAAQPQSEAEAKLEIMRSEGWRKTIFALNEYLRVQKRWNKEEVQSLVARLNARVAQMSAAELLQLQTEMESKLEILLSPEMGQVRGWLEAYTAAMADGYREEFLKKLPDPRKLSAEQLARELQEFELNKAGSARRQAAFEQGRQAKIQLYENKVAASQAASAAAAARMPAGGSSGGPSGNYNPRAWDNVQIGPNLGAGWGGGFW